MSTYPSVKFVTSAAEAHQFAPDDGREIAFAGRSNSGKSTAINAITQRSGLARVNWPRDGAWWIYLVMDSPRCPNGCAFMGWR